MPEFQTGQDTNWHKSALAGDCDENGNPVILGRFRWTKIPDKQASIEADEPVYNRRLIIEHKVFNDDDISNQKLDTSNFYKWQRRFPEAWEAFKSNDYVPEGLLLTEREDGVYLLPQLTPERVQIMHIEGIRTYEDLSTLGDAACTRLGLGTRKLRDAAKELLVERSKPKRGRPPKVDAAQELANVGATP